MNFQVSVKSIIDENYIIILPQSLMSIFTFWKLSDYRINQFNSGYYYEKLLFRVLDENKEIVVLIEENWNSSRFYITLPRSVNSICVELYAENSNGKELLSTSNVISFIDEKDKKESIKAR